MRVAVAAESGLIDMHTHCVEMGCRLNRAQAPSCDVQLTLYTQTQHSCYRRIYACRSVLAAGSGLIDAVHSHPRWVAGCNNRDQARSCDAVDLIAITLRASRGSNTRSSSIHRRSARARRIYACRSVLAAGSGLIDAVHSHPRWVAGCNNRDQARSCDAVDLIAIILRV